MQEKRLIFIRHAHRDNARSEYDNGLSDKGLEQAQMIRDFFATRFETKSNFAFYSSPKKRCLETLKPLADALGHKVLIHAGLNECEMNEDYSAFRLRLEKGLESFLEMKTEINFFCSHGDVLPFLIHKILGIGVEMKKGALIEIKQTQKNFELRWLVQSLKHF
jgi:broad specificity phosphatase PhoE